MGMDVYGNDPSEKAGEYFRNNVWWWHPLWNYCETVAPELTDLVKDAHTNDGDGLNDDDSIKLAFALEEQVNCGATARYEEQYSKKFRKLADEPCSTCKGTGFRKEFPEDTVAFASMISGFDYVGPGKEPCTRCDTSGKARPYETFCAKHGISAYPFSEDNVKKFIEFLRYCGGFQIC